MFVTKNSGTIYLGTTHSSSVRQNKEHQNCYMAHFILSYIEELMVQKFKYKHVIRTSPQTLTPGMLPVLGQE